MLSDGSLLLFLCFRGAQATDMGALLCRKSYKALLNLMGSPWPPKGLLLEYAACGPTSSLEEQWSIAQNQ